MLQRYKLRLGDGTVLGVDHDALRTWAVDGKAMVQAAGTGAWCPLKEFLAQEHADALHAVRLRARSRDRLPQGPAKPLPLVYPKPLPPADLKPLPLVYPKPRQDEPEPPVPVPVAEPREPAALNEPASVQALPAAPPADVSVVSTPPAPVESAPFLDLAAFPVPLEDTPFPDLANLEAPAAEPAVPPSVSLPPDPVESAMPAETVAAEVLEAPLLGDRVEAVTEQNWIPDGPAEVLPPLDDEGAVTEDPAFFEPLDPAGFLPPGKPVGVQALADEPVLPDARSDSSQPSTDDETQAMEPAPQHHELPIIPLKPLEDETPAGLGVFEEGASPVFHETRSTSDLEERLMDLASAYDALLTRWIERLRRRLSSKPPGPSAPERRSLSGKASVRIEDLTEGVSPLSRPDRSSSPVLSSLPPASKSVGLASSPPIAPPLPISELPVLRFAEIPEEKGKGDIYEGETESGPHTAWRWAKRIVVTSALLAGGLSAAVTWETWLPKAEQIARAAFTEVDGFSRAERQRRALREATERLPHLDGKTIQRILTTSPTGVLDPPQVFRLASDAEDRGLSALTAGEAQELKQLRGELLGSLLRSERDRVREYDEARASGVVFPIEDRDIADLVARGAYALPPQSRERLQELLGKAVAAGLAPTNDAGRH